LKTFILTLFPTTAGEAPKMTGAGFFLYPSRESDCKRAGSSYPSLSSSAIVGTNPVKTSRVPNIMSQFTIKVNGQARTVEVAPETPMLWVLRDQLDLVGTKYGCGIGMCGACTVHVDGKPVRSCSLPVSAVGEQQVTTIEGLAADGKLTVVQQAWCTLDVAQCGYCQAGQIMSATALLAEKSKPTDADIDAAMSGNLCRCATYKRIRQAIHTAAAK